MDPQTNNRYVLVTGASTGIGAACALRLARNGWTVFGGVRNAAAGEALQSQAPGHVIPLMLDVTDEQQVRAAQAQIAETVNETGLQGLVNNAGIAVAGVLEFLDMDAIRRQFDVNLFGLIDLTQCVLPLLRSGRGRIVNMGSSSGFFAAPILGAYSASKHALEAVSDTLRLELHGAGIHVAIVEPGAIATPIWEKSGQEAEQLAEKLPQEAHALYAPLTDAIRNETATIVGKAIPPERVASAVEHALIAAKPKTRYCVGTDAHVQRFLARWLPDRLRDALLRRKLGLA